MPEAEMPEHVCLLIAWIRLIIARGAFGEDESNKSPMRLEPGDEYLLIEQICTLAFAQPNEYIRILMESYYEDTSPRTLYENTRYTSDRFIVSAAVRYRWSYLKYASPELRGDREIILVALKYSYGCYLLQYASDDMRKDRDIVLYAVQKNGDSFKYAHEELHKDRNFVLEAVHLNGYALMYASEKLRGDRDIVLAAVQQDGYVLEYASSELWDDSVIFGEAASTNYKQDKYQDGGYSLEFYKNRLYSRVFGVENEYHTIYDHYDDY